MPRYLFHAYDHVHAIDEEGSDLPDLAAARCHAVECARDMMADDVRRGMLDLGFRIEAEDEAGAVVFTLYYRDAIELRDSR